MCAEDDSSVLSFCTEALCVKICKKVSYPEEASIETFYANFCTLCFSYWPSKSKMITKEEEESFLHTITKQLEDCTTTCHTCRPFLDSSLLQEWYDNRKNRESLFSKKCALTLQKTLDLPSFVSTLRPCVHNRTYLAKENILITEYKNAFLQN